jgi:hypothetical protein
MRRQSPGLRFAPPWALCLRPLRGLLQNSFTNPSCYRCNDYTDFLSHQSSSQNIQEADFSLAGYSKKESSAIDNLITTKNYLRKNI